DRPRGGMGGAGGGRAGEGGGELEGRSTGRGRDRRRARRGAGLVRARSPPPPPALPRPRGRPLPGRRVPLRPALETDRSREKRASRPHGRSLSPRPSRASRRLPRIASPPRTRRGPARAPSFSVQRHSYDAAVRRLDSLHAVHQLPHEKEAAPILAVDVAWNRRIDDGGVEIESL